MLLRMMSIKRCLCYWCCSAALESLQVAEDRSRSVCPHVPANCFAEVAEQRLVSLLGMTFTNIQLGFFVRINGNSFAGSLLVGLAEIRKENLKISENSSDCSPPRKGWE